MDNVIDDYITFIPDDSLPEYTKFNVSNIMDNLIDDYITL